MFDTVLRTGATATWTHHAYSTLRAVVKNPGGGEDGGGRGQLIGAPGKTSAEGEWVFQAEVEGRAFRRRGENVSKHAGEKGIDVPSMGRFRGWELRSQ